jgi:DNA/RNA endonuclease YhcR with UshA esterase domain
MTRFMLSLWITFFAFNLSSPPIIPAEAVIKHIGETVKVVDKVYSSNMAAKERVLKIGGSAEHQYLTVIIKSAGHVDLNEQEKAKYTGYNIYVTGKLVKYKGLPAIIVSSPKQMGIVMVDHDLHPAFN